jgi:undecaprenyl diphosphate synthase
MPDASSPSAEHALHIAIIPDGNRRWAKEHRFQPWEGHRKATGVLKNILDWAIAHPEIGALSVFGFSTENWKRDPELVQKLMGMLEQYLHEQRASLMERGVRLLHSGRRDRITPSLAALLADMEKDSQGNRTFTVNLALDYGGRDEIIRAIKRMKDVQSIDEEGFRSFLDHPGLPDIDCLIRTAGEKRISNFFLWQSAYAELIFLDKYFPDLTVQDMEEALAEYRKRTRRFGK